MGSRGRGHGVSWSHGVLVRRGSLVAGGRGSDHGVMIWQGPFLINYWEGESSWIQKNHEILKGSINCVGIERVIWYWKGEGYKQKKFTIHQLTQYLAKTFVYSTIVYNELNQYQYVKNILQQISSSIDKLPIINQYWSITNNLSIALRTTRSIVIILRMYWLSP